jgi:hypothetical protein
VSSHLSKLHAKGAILKKNFNFAKIKKPLKQEPIDENDSLDPPKKQMILKTKTPMRVQPRHLLPKLHEKTMFKAAIEYTMGEAITTRSLID